MRGQNTIALIYPRISQPGQSAYSIETQIEAAEKLAAARGYQIGGVFPDEYSGEELDRPALGALLEAIPRTGARVVLIHDIDRLGREVYIQAITEHQIEQAGARVEFVLEDYSGDSGALLKAVKGGIAAYENRQRVERSRRGKNGRARGGSVICTVAPPYGYDYVPRPHGGDLVIREDQAAVVRQMFHWLTVSRLTSYEIAKRLHEAGIPSKGDLCAAVTKKSGRAEWSPSSVRKLLGNTVYKGVWYWGKTRRAKLNGKRVQIVQPEDQWIAVAVPAIVDADTWEYAQQRLTENKAQARRHAKRDYLLQGRVFCPCGRRWTGRYKNHLDRAYYRCPSTEAESWRKGCTARFGIRQEVIEGRIWRYVIDELLHPDTLTAEIERQRAAASSDAVRRSDRLRAIDASLKDVDRKLEALLIQALDGFPQAIVDRQKRALLDTRRDLEEQRTRAEAEAAREDISPETIVTVQELAAMVQAAEPHFTPEERRRMLDLLRVRVEVIDRQRVRVSGLISGSILDLSCSSRR